MKGMSRRRDGFTLIELMVTLAILTALTTVALRAAYSVQTQGLYKQTTRELNDIQSAVVGPSNTSGAGGSSLVSGFVADTGRLPEYEVSTSDPLTQLSPPQPGDPLTELTYNPNGIPAYGLKQSNVDPIVEIGVGWQGSYISLGAGPTYIRDGWGNSFLCYDGSGNQITTNGTPIQQIASTANGTTPVSIPNATITTNNTGFAYTASIIGQVTMNIGTDTVGGSPLASGPTPNLTFTGTPSYPANSTAVASQPVSIWIAYFGPDLTQSPNPVATDPLLVNYNNAGVWNTPWTGQFPNPLNPNPTYSNITIGPRLLKVYVLPASVTTVSAFNSYVNSASTTNAIYASTTLNVTLVPGTQTINLVLPHYSP
jgi:prepilin-type N-terminal cleavage/methylation domain-containing protein